MSLKTLAPVLFFLMTSLSYRYSFADNSHFKGEAVKSSKLLAWDERTSGKYSLLIKNNTPNKVFVAVHYKFVSDWKTDGYYTLGPFEGPICVSDYKTSNRYIYLFAKNDNGSIWKPSDQKITVQCHNDLIDCYLLDMGVGAKKYTYNLNP